MNTKSLSQYTAKDFVALIDSKFEQYVEKANRTSIEWGTWSREMNLELRHRLDEPKTNKAVIGFVYTYWIVMSQLLDLFYNCKGIKRFLYTNKIKEKINELMDIRGRIFE